MRGYVQHRRGNSSGYNYASGERSGAPAFAMITSKTSSTPPFRYAAVQPTMSADDAWTQVGGGDAT